MLEALIPAGVSVLGGMFAAGQGSAEREKAMQLLQSQLAQIKNIQEPEQRAAKLQELKQVGLLTPEMENAYLQEDTELKQYVEDPQLRSAEMAALQQLQDVASQGGMTATDRARLAEIQSEQRQTERGAREAVMQNARQRGMTGSGNELMASLQAGQSAADRASRAGVDVEAQAEQRALDAMMRSGELGGNIRGQDWQQAQAKAQAQDAINQFNTQTQQGVMQRNIAQKNAANQYNLTNQQNIANQNVGLQNQEQMYNLEAGQRAYDNAMKKANAGVGATNAYANSLQGEGNRQSQLWGGITQGAAYGIGSALRPSYTPQSNIAPIKYDDAGNALDELDKDKVVAK